MKTKPHLKTSDHTRRLTLLLTWQCCFITRPLQGRAGQPSLTGLKGGRGGGRSVDVSSSERNQERALEKGTAHQHCQLLFYMCIQIIAFRLIYPSNNCSHFPEQGITDSPLSTQYQYKYKTQFSRPSLVSKLNKNFLLQKKKPKIPTKERSLHCSRIFYPILITALTSSEREIPQHFKAAHLVPNTICPAPTPFVTYILKGQETFSNIGCLSIVLKT